MFVAIFSCNFCISTFQISMSIKMFGNEVKYAVLSGKGEIDDALENLNPLKIIKNFLSGKVRHYNLVICYLILDNFI